MSVLSRLLIATAFSATTLAVHAQDVVRHPVPDFPISSAVEVPSGYTTVYVSGSVPDAVSEQDYGNTEQQTESVLAKIKTTLASMDLTMGDVVKMQVFLVGDPAMDAKMDFSGFMKAYTRYFGSDDQPAMPARSVMQVAGLVHPNWLVEIEVTAVKKAD